MSLALRESVIECSHCRELFRCQSPLRKDLPALSALSALPHRLGDVPRNDGDNVMLELLVSDQGMDDRPVDIDVILDDVHLVTGDFSFTQHNPNWPRLARRRTATSCVS